MKGDDANRKKTEADRANAEEASLKVMERVGETKKRQKDQGAHSEVKKKGEVEIERNIRERELDFKKAEVQEEANRSAESQQHMQDMLHVMHQQQVQAQNMQTVLIQQQQQQNTATLALIDKLAKK